MYGPGRVETGRKPGDQDTTQRKSGKFYRLSLLFSEIIDDIGRYKLAEADQHLEMTRQLRDYIATQQKSIRIDGW